MTLSQNNAFIIADIETKKLQQKLLRCFFLEDEPAALELLESLEKNIDINLPVDGHSGDTLLIICIKYGLENCVIKLLDLGVAVDRENAWGETALHTAIIKKKPYLAFKLINKGADINALTRTNKSTLYLAIEQNLDELISMLIKAGTHLFVVDSDNNTLLDVAIRQGLVDLAKTLKSLGLESKKPSVGVIEVGHFYHSTLHFLKQNHITWFSIQLKNMASLNTIALVDEINDFNQKRLKDENETLATNILSSPGVNIQLIRRYIADIIPLLDGIWLTGGEDIPQIFYLDNHSPLTHKDSENAARTVLEIALIERQALMPELPLVAVCRGLQIFNVAKAGTLLNIDFGHFEIQHITKIAYSGLGAHLIKENMQAQSLHNQAVDKLGHHLEVVAEYDGVAKALQSTQPGSQVFLYQFHPEYSRFEPDNQRLLESLITTFELSKNKQSYPFELQVNKHNPYWQVEYCPAKSNFQDKPLNLEPSNSDNALSIGLPKEGLPFTKKQQPLFLKNHDINYITLISGLIVLFTLLKMTKNLFRLTFCLNNGLTRQTKAKRPFALDFFKKPSIQTEIESTCRLNPSL